MSLAGIAGWWVVTLNWNGGEDTSRCLDSLAGVPGLEGARRLRRQRFVGRVAGGDPPHAPGRFACSRPARTSLLGRNNVGIRYALERGAEWVVLVNNDATVAPDTIAELAAAAARWPRAGILAGKVLYADAPETVWWAGQSVNLRTGYSGRPDGYGRPDGPE